ncbi:cytochrome P460 family protein [Falsiroseomonas oryziterrae]|uniref:cytochrome P460 family protein n=1 Tax=Falsiroseomonas oryziterrae TaxID=2911368 RepID=UPI001F2FC51B|nr:cytochrome P460 family protein [Roseomonas sp. NPKOSM-4]
MTLIALPAALLALVGATAAQPGDAHRTREPRIVLPHDWEQRFIRYATVDDADRRIVRHVHVDPDAHARLRPGMPAPDGTLLIMADARARLDTTGQPLRDAGGRFLPEPGWIALFAKRKDARRDRATEPGLRNGDWDYAAFDGAGRPRDVSLAACFACHQQARAAQDYTFTLWDYAATRGGGR